MMSEFYLYSAITMITVLFVLDHDIRVLFVLVNNDDNRVLFVLDHDIRVLFELTHNDDISID